MARLTKYDSFEALKADASSKNGNTQTSDERYRALETFITLLRTEQDKKRKNKIGDNETAL